MQELECRKGEIDSLRQRELMRLVFRGTTFPAGPCVACADVA